MRVRGPAEALLTMSLVMGGCADDVLGGSASYETLSVSAEVIAAAPGWELDPDLRIGAGNELSGHVFGYPAGLAVDGSERLFVLDVVSSRLSAFDHTGEFLYDIGRVGSGPGEFRQPIGLAISGDTLVLSDAALGRISLFSLDGTFIGVVNRESTSSSLPWRGGFDRSGRFGEILYNSEGSVLLRHRNDWTAVEVFDLPRYEPAVFVRNSATTATSAFVPFSPRLEMTFDPLGGIWAGISDTYQLYHVDVTGDTTLSVRIAGRSEEVTSADRQKAIEGLQWFVRQGGEIDQSRFPRTKPLFWALHMDDAGRIWIRRDEQAAVYDVVTRSGDYLARISLAGNIPAHLPFVVHNGSIYAVVVEGADIPVVARYSLPQLD